MKEQYKSLAEEQEEAFSRMGRLHVSEQDEAGIASMARRIEGQISRILELAYELNNRFDAAVVGYDGTAKSISGSNQVSSNRSGIEGPRPVVPIRDSLMLTSSYQNDAIAKLEALLDKQISMLEG